MTDAATRLGLAIARAEVGARALRARVPARHRGAFDRATHGLVDAAVVTAALVGVAPVLPREPDLGPSARAMVLAAFVGVARVALGAAPGRARRDAGALRRVAARAARSARAMLARVPAPPPTVARASAARGQLGLL